MHDPGQRDRLIVLQTFAVSQDPDSGEERFTLSDSTSLYAEWLPAGTREAYQAQQRLQTYIEGVFRIQYRTPPPDAKVNRIVFEGRTFDLKPPIEEGRRDGLLVPAVAHGENP